MTRRSHLARLALAVVVPASLAALLPADVAGQETGDLAGDDRKRLTFTFEMGNPAPDAGGGLADQLRRAGYDDTAPTSCFFIFCSGPTTHPFEADGGPSASVRTRCALGPSVAVDLGYGPPRAPRRVRSGLVRDGGDAPRAALLARGRRRRAGPRGADRLPVLRGPGDRGHLVPSSADVTYPVSDDTGQELPSLTLRPGASRVALFVGTGVRF